MPRISETEWEVMKVIWQHAPCSASQVIDSLNRVGAAWHPKTVKAFLNRLVKKKAIDFKVDGRSYLYRPLVTESDCAEAASRSFLQRVFGGSFKPMLAHFVARGKFSREEIAELKKLLDSKD